MPKQGHQNMRFAESCVHCFSDQNSPCSYLKAFSSQRLETVLGASPHGAPWCSSSISSVLSSRPISMPSLKSISHSVLKLEDIPSLKLICQSVLGQTVLGACPLVLVFNTICHVIRTNQHAKFEVYISVFSSERTETVLRAHPLASLYGAPLVLIFNTIRPSIKANQHAKIEVDISKHSRVRGQKPFWRHAP